MNLRSIFKCDGNIQLTVPAYKKEGFELCFTSKELVQESPIQIEYEFTVTPPLPNAASELHAASIQSARVLCLPQDGFKPVYELSLDVEDTTIANNFKPGDTIGILPHNTPQDVEFILQSLQVATQADLPYKLKSVASMVKTHIPKHVPVMNTIRNTLTCCVELRALVKKLFIRSLSTHCIDEKEKQSLEFMCSKEGSQLYTENVLKKNVTLLDILKEFPSCKPSVECILSHLPRLLPRPYSVANSSLSSGNVIKICFSVSDLTQRRKGLTTEWLEMLIQKRLKSNLEDCIERLSVNEEIVPIYLRNNLTFNFPHPSENVVMIGPGVGVAPYVGYLEERRQLKEENPSTPLGTTWLFYGCRNSDVDFIYKDELNGFLDDGVLSRLTTTCSRMDNDSVKYVQDAIKKLSAEVCQFILDGAHILVCGDLSTMAKQVEVALAHCVHLHTHRTRDEATEFIKNLQREKKYLVDVWS